MKIFAMSDLHGCVDAFDAALAMIDLSGDAMLILLGDYVHGPNDSDVLDRIMQLQQEYGSDKVVALVGNHEEMVMSGRWPLSNMTEDQEDRYRQWMESLPRYYATERQIFCHAGVEEEAGEMWEWGTDDYTYTEKYPAQTGPFCMDIVAGHIGTAEISGDLGYHDIYFDGYAHYYVDGTVLDSGNIPVLMVDTETDQYYRITESGCWSILPYNEEE